jgi:hypothetical protein
MFHETGIYFTKIPAADSYYLPSIPLQEGKDFLPPDTEQLSAKRRQ